MSFLTDSLAAEQRGKVVDFLNFYIHSYLRTGKPLNSDRLNLSMKDSYRPL